MGNSQLKTFKVSGDSMYPLLHDGQEITVRAERKYKPGDIVVAIHPIQTDIVIVKQVDEVHKAGKLKLRGVNSKASSDKFGLVSPKFILGKMIQDLD